MQDLVYGPPKGLENRDSMPLASRSTVRVEKPPRPWLQDLWLWILLVGPLVAPLFAATGWSVLRPVADGIYMLGQAICPKVSEHMMVWGEAMAVCASCWAAVWGLWVVRLIHGRAGEGFGPFMRLGLTPYWMGWRDAPITIKLSVLLAGFLPWAFDVMMWDTGTWRSPQPFMMLVGFIGGIAAGVLLLPMAAEMRDRLAARERSRRLARLRAKSHGYADI